MTRSTFGLRFGLRFALHFALRLTLRFGLHMRCRLAIPDRDWHRGPVRSLTYIPVRGSRA